VAAKDLKARVLWDGVTLGRDWAGDASLRIAVDGVPGATGETQTGAAIVAPVIMRRRPMQVHRPDPPD